MNRIRIAVTGATGFLGSHLVRRLMRDGHEVAALIRDPNKLAAQKLEPVSVVEGDIRDPEALGRLIKGVDVCFHLVSNFRTAADSPAVSEAVNVRGTQLALETAMNCGVERFIHCSTIGVHGNVRASEATETSPFNPGDVYQRTKLAAEELVRSHMGRTKTDIVVIRPCSLYGPGDMRMLKMFSLLAQRRFLTLGSCNAHFHAAYIDDAVEGFILAMSSNRAANEVFLIGGAQHIPLRDYIRAAAQAVGAPEPWLKLPYWPMYAASAVVEAACVPLGLEPFLHRRRVRFFRNHRAFSIEKARSLLGYEPSVGLEEGMQRTVAWYRQQGLLRTES